MTLTTREDYGKKFRENSNNTLYLDMGYDELSVSPGRVLELRKKVCESEV